MNKRYKLKVGNVGQKVIAQYKKIEQGIVTCYKKIEKKFIDTFLEEVNSE